MDDPHAPATCVNPRWEAGGGKKGSENFLRWWIAGRTGRERRVRQVRWVRSHMLHAVGGDAGAIHVSLGTHKFARTLINRGRWRERGTRGRVRFSRFRTRQCGLVWESRWNLSLGRGPRSHEGIRYKAAIVEPLLRPVCFSPRIWMKASFGARRVYYGDYRSMRDVSRPKFIAREIILDEKSEHHCYGESWLFLIVFGSPSYDRYKFD